MNISNNKVYKSSQINLKSFELKTLLNPKIWVNNKLRPKVRKQLITIAKEFIKSTDIKFIPIDVIMVGSLASYNWSKYSDIDLHIFCDFSKINEDTVLIKNYFDAKKNEWNNTHGDITIYGYEVELYVQDINELNASNGIYSIKNNMWIKFPDHVNVQLKSNDIKRLALDYISKIDYYAHKFDELTDKKQFLLLQAKCDWLYKIIRNGRRDSLNQEGEQATGNIVFKVLRRSGHFGILRDLRNKIFDKLNSLALNESFFDDIDTDLEAVRDDNIHKMIDIITDKGVVEKLLDKYHITGEIIEHTFEKIVLLLDKDDVLIEYKDSNSGDMITKKCEDWVNDIDKNYKHLFSCVDLDTWDEYETTDNLWITCILYKKE